MERALWLAFSLYKLCITLHQFTKFIWLEICGWLVQHFRHFSLASVWFLIKAEQRKDYHVLIIDQRSEHFRSSRMWATCEGSASLSVVSLRSGMLWGCWPLTHSSLGFEPLSVESCLVLSSDCFQQKKKKLHNMSRRTFLLLALLNLPWKPFSF